MDDKDKSKFDEMVQTATSGIGEAAKSAVLGDVPLFVEHCEAAVAEVDVTRRWWCLVRDQLQKRLGSRSLGFRARRPSRRGTILALVGRSLIIVKLEDHDIGAPILGMGREVAISRRIPVLVKATTNCHDLPRTVLLASVLKRVNCVREPADEGRGDHFGCPYLATARPVAVERRSMFPPQCRLGSLSADK